MRIYNSNKEIPTGASVSVFTYRGKYTELNKSLDEFMYDLSITLGDPTVISIEAELDNKVNDVSAIVVMWYIPNLYKTIIVPSTDDVERRILRILIKEGVYEDYEDAKNQFDFSYTIVEELPSYDKELDDGRNIKVYPAKVALYRKTES